MSVTSLCSHERRGSHHHYEKNYAKRENIALKAIISIVSFVGLMLLWGHVTLSSLPLGEIYLIDIARHTKVCQFHVVI